MALLGGGIGGAGNPVGGSFTGPAQQLEIAGDNAYAYSGPIPVGGVTDLVSFTTGNFVFEGRIYTGYCDRDAAIANDVSFGVLLNGTLVAARYLDTSKETYQNQLQYITIIIPPYTEVQVQGQNISDPGGSDDLCCVMTGKIYRTRN